MKNLIFALLCIGILLLSGCEQQNVSEEETGIVLDDSMEEATPTPDESPEVIFNNPLDEQRLQLINRTILPEVVLGNANASGKNASSDEASVVNQQPYYWTWVAKLDAPVVNGLQLSATHCNVFNNRAYVSYNKQGNEHIGALEIVDVGDVANPVLIEQILFPLADVNAVTAVSGSEIWVATSHKLHGASVYRLNPDLNQYDRINLSNSLETGISASTNGIAFTNSYVIVTAGKTYGGTFLIDRNSLEVLQADAYPNAKYVAVNGNGDNAQYAAMVTGFEATIHSGQVSSFGEDEISFSIGTIDHVNVELTQRGKNTLQFDPFDPNKVFCSMGQTGLKVYDINTGNLLNESKGSMLVEGNTNAVTLDQDYMYIANGADGIAIGEHVETGQEINPMFVWDRVEMPASANYITAENDFIFISKGLGGFHILYKQEKAPYTTVTPYTDKGKPIALEPDEDVCPELLPNLFATVLPERENALIAHPEYFEHPAKNIVLEEEAEVKVTFINEGAGFKNILGYYVYDAESPPQSVEDVVKVVIFPNASAQGSGGDLIPGNTVKLLGTFPAGTVIGFFVIADGWRNGKITDGFYSQYTNSTFNNSGAQQSLVFYDSECDATIICFEDISIPQGDKDFNDAIFQISASPSTAIQSQDYIQIR